MPIKTGGVVGGHEVTERFVRSMGPDGRNARRKATAVELRFDIGRSSLPADAPARLIAVGGRHVTRDGILVIVSRRYSSQARNREAARAQLLQLLREAT